MYICICVYLSVLMMAEWEGFRHHNNGHHGSSLSYELFVSLHEPAKPHNACEPLLLKVDEFVNHLGCGVL